MHQNRNGQLNFLHSLKVLILFVFAVSCVVYAGENNMLFFDNTTSSFKENASLPPFGEKLIIKGTGDSTLEKVSVTSMYGENEATTSAAINGENWTAVVGPFPKRANVIFIIRMKQKITDAETKKIVNTVKNSIRAALDTFISKGQALDSNSFLRYVDSLFHEGIGHDLEPYSVEGDSSLESVLLGELRNLLLDDNIRSELIFKDVSKDYFFEYAKDSLKNIHNDNPSGFCAAIEGTNDLNTLVTVNSLPLDSTLQSFFVSIKENCARNDSANAALEKMVSGISRILKETTVVTTMTTSQEILGIQNYIGFDVGLIYVHKLVKTPFFVTVSPYFLRIDPEKDYSLNSWKSIFYFITPTLGFGFGDGLDDISPIYYVGLGYRINKIVRITGGGAFYQETGNKSYTWSQALGLSISVDYISDFIKMIGSAQSSTSNE